MQAPFSRTVFDLLREQAAVRPEAPAAIFEDITLSYAELVQRALAVAGALTDEGVERGDRIALLSDNRPEWLDVFFGAAALGVAVAPFSTWSTIAELEFLLNDSEAEFFFTLSKYGDRDYSGGVRELVDDFKLHHLQDIIEIDGPAFAPFATGTPATLDGPGGAASAGDRLVTLYTSGSSSRPKSVPLLHYAAIENGFNIGERQGLTPEDRVLISIPLCWSYGAANALMAALSHGAAMVIQPRFEPAGAIDLIERHGCTAIYTLPAMTNAILASPAFKPERTASLRTGVTIGSPVDIQRAANELGANEICNIYGQTESYGNCCVTPHDWPLERRMTSQGPPLPGVSIRVRDPESDAILDIGEVGEIEIYGYLTPGYVGDSSKFNPDVFSDDGYFQTGDLGVLNPDGSISYAGRITEMIKRSGINVSPTEVEEILARHPAVGLAGVTGVADDNKGELIVAFVVPRPGETPDAAALIAHCRDLLSSYKLPDHIFLRDALPLTPTGKLMRRELAEEAIAAVEGAG